MKTLTVKRFTTNCAKILHEVRKTRKPVLIREGKTILVKLIPYRVSRKRFFGALAGRMKIVGDIESPIWLEEEKADLKQRRLQQ